jgi:hypothetical protein
MRKTFIFPGLLLLLTVSSCKKAENVATDGSGGLASYVMPAKAAASDNAAESRSPLGRTSAPAVATPNAMPASKPAPSPRMIVRTASLSLIVANAADAMQALTRQAAQFGGYVTDSKQWRENDQLRGTITLRIPSERFDDMTATVKKSAVRVQSESVTGEDVTQEFSDLGARLRNAEAAEIELRELLTSIRQRSQKAEEVLEVYAKLHEIRGEIEQIKGRMQYLRQVTAMSTMTVELIPDVLAQPVVETGWSPSAVAHRAVRRLISTMQGLAEVAIWLAIYLLPIVAVIAFATLLFGWVAKRFLRALRRT